MTVVFLIVGALALALVSYILGMLKGYDMAMKIDVLTSKQGDR